MAISDAFTRILSPASRIRYPRYPDSSYGDEAKKFSAVYFATLDDNESNLFTNNYIVTTSQTLSTITDGTLGAITETIMKQSSASSSSTTDWGGSTHTEKLIK